MTPAQILGVTLFAVGGTLLWLAYGAWDTPLDQVTTALSGRHPDRTIWYLVLGAAATVGGGSLAIFSMRTP